VDLVLKLRNEGDRPVDIRLGHDRGGLEMTMLGEGAVHVPLGRPFVADFRRGNIVTIEPGAEHQIPIQSLQYGFRNATDRLYWTRPGEYLLHVTLTWPSDEIGMNMHAVTADPVSLTVRVHGQDH
jgi:hypothetical protein